MACTASRTTIPSPAATWYSFSSPRSRVPRNSRKRRCSATLFPFLNECHQIRRERRLRLAPHRHAVPFFLNDDLLARLALIGIGIVAARVRAAALGPLECRAGGRLGDDEQRAQVDRGVPAGIVFAAPEDPHFPHARLELLELGERGLQACLVAHNSRVALHDGLERRLHRKRILAVALEGVERLTHRLLDLVIRYRRRRAAPGRRVLAGPASEDEQVAERVAAEAVGAVHAAADFARRGETGDRRFLRSEEHT